MNRIGTRNTLLEKQEYSVMNRDTPNRILITQPKNIIESIADSKRMRSKNLGVNSKVKLPAGAKSVRSFCLGPMSHAIMRRNHVWGKGLASKHQSELRTR